MSRSEWTRFLQQQGAELNALATAISAAPPANTDTHLVPLLDQGVLSLTGPDGEKFLQGQTTCDLRQLSTTQSLLGSNCSPKGNVISLFRLIKRADQELLLRLPQSILEPALANLKKYIVFSKAEVVDASEQWVGLGILGEQAAAVAGTLFEDLPEQDGEQRIKDGLTLIRVPGERFELWANSEQLVAHWPTLAASAALADSNRWQLSELQAGLPQLDGESVDTLLPHMLNLQAVGGISFDKGCYTGQEVIARLQFRGRLKKLLFRAQVGSDTDPEIGMALHTPERKSIGKVLAMAKLPGNEGYELQALINKGEADKGNLRLGTQDGPIVSLLPLPYPIDPELFERS